MNKSRPLANSITIEHTLTPGSVLQYDGSNWIIMRKTIGDLIQKLGNEQTHQILLEEIVERQLRETDEELNQLWQEYKTLAKLKADYNKNIDELSEK